MNLKELISQLEAFIFDLDGTLYLGDGVIPGAAETVAVLRSLNKRTLFITNKPLEPREAYAAKLTRLGIPTRKEEVITSAYVLGYHLAKTAPRLRLYVVGEPYLKDELRSHGFFVVEERYDQDEREVIDTKGIDAVVVAFDRTLNYRKLNTAYQALTRGARFFATNPDKTCPMPGGGIPDAGATLAALEHLTGRRAELMAGKPSRLMMQVAMESIQVPAESFLILGDRLETDIRMGKEAGMFAAVVLTGASSREDALRADPAPDFILESVSDLLAMLTPTK